MDGGFWYVYMLQSVEHPEHYYVGITEDLPERLKSHNAGKAPGGFGVRGGFGVSPQIINFALLA